MVVVTDTKDEETARVCEFNNVQCVKTDVFYDDPNVREKPNKARGINEGLKQLSKDGWVLHMDSDIWLPCLTRHIIENYPLNDKSIYGIDRLMCNTYSDWVRYVYHGKPLNEGWCYVHTDQFPMGVRIVKYHSEGYLPIGYFQLWNPNGSGVYDYPEVQASFDRTDVLHAQQFDREQRKFIPDVICIHLASENHKQGQNWFGRKTRPFRPMTFKEKFAFYWYRFTFNAANVLGSIFPALKKKKNHVYEI
jgi:hypothetical protein